MFQSELAGNEAIISDAEYAQALSIAQRKSQYINRQYGTHHGSDYLAVLVAEEVSVRRLANELRVTAQDSKEVRNNE